MRGLNDAVFPPSEYHQQEYLLAYTEMR